MFHDLFVPNIVPLFMKHELLDWENRPFTALRPEKLENKVKINEPVKKTIIKKKKRFRTAFTTQQLLTLEDVFRKRKYIDGETRRNIAKSLNISDTSIKTWFQNRRMKEKREDAETSDCSSESPSVSSSQINQQPFHCFDTLQGSQQSHISSGLLQSQSPDTTGTDLPDNYMMSVQNPPTYTTEACNDHLPNLANNSSNSILPSYQPEFPENPNLAESNFPQQDLNNSEMFGYRFPCYVPPHPVPGVGTDFYNDTSSYSTYYYPYNDYYCNNVNSYYDEFNQQNNWH